MRRMSKKIRALVVKRAGGHCENCMAFVGDDGHLDHQFGRAKVKESVANCWLLCLRCDHEKTTNHPSAQVWLERFAIHAALYAYVVEVEMALTKIAVLKAKGLAA